MTTLAQILAAIGLLTAIGVAVLSIFAAFAPIGWQDETGFHEGREP